MTTHLEPELLNQTVEAIEHDGFKLVKTDKKQHRASFAFMHGNGHVMGVHLLATVHLGETLYVMRVVGTFPMSNFKVHAVLNDFIHNHNSDTILDKTLEKYGMSVSWVHQNDIKA
jgi:hypothetical protein